MTAWRVRVAHSGGSPRDVLLEGDEATSRGGLIRALRSVGYPSTQAYVDGQRWTVDDGESLDDSVLCNGSLITDVAATDEPIAPGTYFVSIGGPASGRSARLEPGVPLVVGRNLSGRGLLIDDDLISSEHLSVELGDDGTVSVADLESRNGSMYEGQGITSAAMEAGCLVRAGSSLFTTVVLTEDDRATIRGTTATGLNLHRQFREALRDMPAAPKAPNKPRDPDKLGGTPWWRSLMPLVTAVGMAWMFGRWQFLLIAAFSPIIYALDNQRRKRQLRETVQREQDDYVAAMERYQRTIDTNRHAEVRRTREQSISGGYAALLAQFRHRRVWERKPGDPDFLAVTLGYASLTSTYADDKVESTTKPLWQAPLAISLLDEGPLSITGPPERAAAVTRSLLTDVTFAHAPTDVNVWVFSQEERADDWGFVQWLPHAYTDDGGARLATTINGRSHLMKLLNGLIEARSEQTDGREATLHLPIQIVVVDGVDNIAPDELTKILRIGPSIGVIGIVADRAVVPEGIRGQIRLGRFDDECSYRSEATPRVDEVAVSQITSDLAHRAAMQMAPLEAFGRSGASRPVGSVYFTELLRFGDRTPAEQVEVWREQSPRTSVPVGVGMDGQTFSVDFLKHGPHGLIGGMTRSGKTEFLKTLFSSLALHNHPDDLAIAIIDFKGGVDHQQTGRLPHVVVLATNQDIDLFERTVTLIAAEQERRQRIFRDEAGASTLEGYRTARERRPELIPIPRLLVIVDEFVELLETAEGKAQIGRLEQIARIGAGLGVHLLLVTQDFTSSLPPQIDGQAGLRMCFRVGKVGDSKTVLQGSSAAAGISTSTKGRGFAKFSGGDVTEFQSARIGNQARELVVDDDQISAYHVTADSLAQPPEPPDPKEVPDHEQDLYRVVEVARAAAAAIGHRRSAVPWPDDLPDEVSLVGLYERFPDERRMLIGVADEPQAQRNVPVHHSFADSVVAYAGSADSGHHEALLVTAAAAATSCSPDDLHIYGIDLVGRGLGLIDPLPHVGTVATRDDATGVRVLNWLMTETLSRRATIARLGAPDFATYVQMGGTELPQIMLLVLGIDRTILHSESGSSPLLGPMTTLANEVTGTGIQIVFSGIHQMLTNRFGSVASRRLVFAANDPGEYPASVPKPFRAQLNRAGRCVDSATGLLSQVGRINLDGDVRRDAGAGTTNGGGAPVEVRDEVSTRDLFLGLAELVNARTTMTRAPKRFARAPWPLQLDDIAAAEFETQPAGAAIALPFGVSPDSGAMVWIDPREDGTAFRIVGGPKSGRSNALAAIALMAQRVGWQVYAAVASQRSAILSVPDLTSCLVPIDTLTELLGDGVSRPTLVVVDDAHRLDEEYPWKKLVVEGGPVITVVAGSTDGLTRPQFNRGLGVTGGAVLMPTKTRDPQAVGLKDVDDEWVLNPLAGIGVAGIASEGHRIQFPLVVTPTT